jgi:hypothetical protein
VSQEDRLPFEKKARDHLAKQRIATFGQNKPQNTDWLKMYLNSKVTKK